MLQERPNAGSFDLIETLRHIVHPRVTAERPEEDATESVPIVTTTSVAMGVMSLIAAVAPKSCVGPTLDSSAGRSAICIRPSTYAA